MAELHINLEQAYSISSNLEISCEQLYSMLLEIWLTALYGDVPVLTPHLTTPYKSARVLDKTLLCRWSSALSVETHLETGWAMPGTLEPVSVHGWGIAGEVINLTATQLYNINQNTKLFKDMAQGYGLVGDAVAAVIFDTKLFAGDERIPFIQCEWEASETNFDWSCEFIVKDFATAAKCPHGTPIRIEDAGEIIHLLAYGGWMRDKHHKSERYRVKAYSKSKNLAEATPILGDIPGGMAAQIVADLAGAEDITVDYRMDDDYIHDGELTANEESPMDVIRKLVRGGGGRVCSALDGNLIIPYQEEVPVPQWHLVEPAATIIARLERISTSDQLDRQAGFNRFLVSDQLAATKTREDDQVMLDGRTCEVRQYATPMADVLGFELSHRGPAGVSIEQFGLVSELIEDELVEIKAGVGRTRRPIYRIASKKYQMAGLGAVSYTEDRIITTEISDYSLILITYETRYYKWIAIHRLIGEVQFVVNELEAAI